MVSNGCHITTNCKRIKKTIAGLKDSIKRMQENFYKVKSQSNNGKEYDVNLIGETWICSCPDFAYRNEKCKHIFAVEFGLKLKQQVREQIVIAPVNISDCIFCQKINRRGHIACYK